jgi:hypothetical protein
MTLPSLTYIYLTTNWAKQYDKSKLKIKPILSIINFNLYKMHGEYNIKYDRGLLFSKRHFISEERLMPHITNLNNFCTNGLSAPSLW